MPGEIVHSYYCTLSAFCLPVTSPKMILSFSDNCTNLHKRLPVFCKASCLSVWCLASKLIYVLRSPPPLRGSHLPRSLMHRIMTPCKSGTEVLATCDPHTWRRGRGIPRASWLARPVRSEAVGAARGFASIKWKTTQTLDICFWLLHVLAHMCTYILTLTCANEYTHAHS